MLKVLLQPIVENAIYHGLKQRRGPGNIRIRTAVEEQVLLLTVEDDGIGIPAEKLAELRDLLERSTEHQPGSSCGKFRLWHRECAGEAELSFGDRFGVRIESGREEGRL